MKQPTESQPPTPFGQLTLKELITVLIKHNQLHEGLYDLSVEFQIAIGAVGPSTEALFPGAMLGISRIGLMPAEQKTIHTVDAAEVNPRKKSKKKVTSD